MPKQDNLIEIGRNKKGQFVAGFIPWNKGDVEFGKKFGFRKGHKCFSLNSLAEWRKRGGVPWNKGIKGKESHSFGNKHSAGLVPWNKGKKCPQISGENHPMYGKKHTKETIETISETWFKKGERSSPDTEFKKGQEGRKGKDNHFWKGGITSLIKRIRTSLKYRQWRSDIYTRDDFTCQICEQKGGKLHAHHIKSFSKMIEENEIKTFKQAMNCEELWNINNGITFCKECHKETDNYGGKSAKK